MIGFDRSGADAEFFRDPAGPETGASQRKDMQLAVGQVRSARLRCRMIGQLVNGKQGDRQADIKLTCENSFNGMD